MFLTPGAFLEKRIERCDYLSTLKYYTKYNSKIGYNLEAKREDQNC